jgi:hypothetical protein
MVYEVPIGCVEKLERAISKHIRRWLGLPPSFTGVGLYSKSTKLQIPISSVVEEFKVGKARLLLTLRDSADEKISGAGIEVRTGRKWSVTRAVDQAESSLRHRDIVGATNVGREGFGNRQHSRWDNSGIRERREMVQSEIRRGEEEVRAARIVQMGLQGRSSRWSVPERKLTWDELWKYEPLQLSVLLRSVYDMLPTPANLSRWKLSEDSSCVLCKEKGTLQHIMSSCQKALGQGRYRWRHDQVLAQLADVLERERRKERTVSNGPRLIGFVREGAGKVSTSVSTGLLYGAEKWEMRVDLGRKLVFPDIVHTTLRPDIVLWSETPKVVILVELTVPWEERTEEAYERKMAKYQELAGQCREKGWKTSVFPVEVGCRGFPAQSVWRMLSALGIRGKTRKEAARNLGNAAQRASSWLWLRRNDELWQPTQMGSA